MEEPVPSYDLALDRVETALVVCVCALVNFNNVEVPVCPLGNNIITGVDAVHIGQGRRGMARVDRTRWSLPVGRILSLLNDVADHRRVLSMRICPMLIEGTSREFEDLGECLKRAFPELGLLTL